MFEKPLEGNWEERGVIGTRLEFRGSVLTVLWRNAPVLVTKFKLKKTPDGTRVLLQKNGLRYENDVKDYATLTGLTLCEGKLRMEENFPITGPSVTTLEKTPYSRYGNVEIVDKEILPLLKGKWTDERGVFTAEFSGSTMSLNGKKIAVCAVRGSMGIKIIDKDPSHYDFGFMSFLDFEGSVLTAHELILDAPPSTVRFTKQS